MSNATEMPSMQGLGSVIAQNVRAIYFFDIPASLQKHGIKKIGMVELLASEELMASKRAGMNPLALAAELAKEALRRVDGRTVSTSDGSADFVIQNLHPKIRTLVGAAYQKIHQPESNENQDFLKSMELVAG